MPLSAVSFLNVSATSTLCRSVLANHAAGGYFEGCCNRSHGGFECSIHIKTCCRLKSSGRLRRHGSLLLAVVRTGDARFGGVFYCYFVFGRGFLEEFGARPHRKAEHQEHGARACR